MKNWRGVGGGFDGIYGPQRWLVWSFQFHIIVIINFSLQILTLFNFETFKKCRFFVTTCGAKEWNLTVSKKCLFFFTACGAKEWNLT